MAAKCSNSAAIILTCRKHRESFLAARSNCRYCRQRLSLEVQKMAFTEEISYKPRRELIEDANAGDFDHTIGIIEALDLDQGNRRKILPKNRPVSFA